jgi:uncharacterized protein with GYD domain
MGIDIGNPAFQHRGYIPSGRSRLPLVPFVTRRLAAISENGGSTVRTQLEALGEGIGGKVEAFYFTLGGDYHGIAIVTTPDAVTAWGGYLACERAGLVSTEVTELVDASILDEAAKLSRKLFTQTQ